MEMRQLFSVLLVLALLGAAVWALRRRGGVKGWPKSGKSLVSLERLALTPHHSLHLVRIRDREVLVAVHPRGCTVLEGIKS